MSLEAPWSVSFIFFIVVGFIIWRPRGINEAIPASMGALAVFLLGFITVSDIKTVFNIVLGAGITILSTIIMSSILDRAGFFRWAAVQLAIKAKGSGKKLFLYVLVLCFLMTLFFNNDGSILITTPIILEITRRLKFSKRQSLPYLLGGAIICTSSSAPIGVSNLANLIALRIVGLDLNSYAKFMFLPSMIGIALSGILLYRYYRHEIIHDYKQVYLSEHIFPPRTGEEIPPLPIRGPHIHLRHKDDHLHQQAIDYTLFTIGILTVIAVRIGFFIASHFKIPIEIVAISGAIFLLFFYGIRKPQGIWPILNDAPWYIVLFAFSMYLLVFSLHNQGLTGMLGHIMQWIAHHSLLGLITATGVLLTIMSSLMNNLPSVMIGTIMLNDLHLPEKSLQLSYLANVLGSDIGSLLLPMGTLASLLWFHMVSKQLDITWKDYMKVSFLVIPPSLFVSLLALYLWGNLILQ